MEPNDAAAEGWHALPDGAVTEVTFLLPAHQAAALDRMAFAEGLTVGHLLRRLIRGHLARANRRGEGRVDGADGSP
jgi:hypothetical protein